MNSALLGAITSAIIVGFFTLMAGPLGTWFLNEKKYRREASSIRSALLSEIESLREIANKREYRVALEACANGGGGTLKVIVPDHYCRVYQSLVNKVGYLDELDARRVVLFYQYLDSVVQDVSEGGVLAMGAPSHCFQQTLDVYDLAMEQAAKLLGHDSRK